MVDLHIHSLYSDGTYEVEEIVKQAKAKKLDIIALTDHNTFDGNKELKKLCEKYNQNALAGIELSTSYNNKEIHVLGYYGIDTDFDSDIFDNIKKDIINVRKQRIIQLQAIVQNISKDYDVNVEEFNESLKKYPIKQENFNRLHIAKYLVEKNIAESINEAFNEFLNEESIYYVPKKNIDLLEAIKEINLTGGFISIAHLVQYHMNYEEIKQMLQDISSVTNNIHIELFHPDHKEKNIENYWDIIREFKENGINIQVTAGSDCHGENKINEIGKTCNFELKGDYKKIYIAVSENIKYFCDIEKIKYNFTPKIRYIDALNTIQKAAKLNILEYVDDDKHVAVYKTGNADFKEGWYKEKIDDLAHVLMKDYDAYNMINSKINEIEEINK